MTPAAEPSSADRTRSGAIDGLRAIAVLLVLVAHAVHAGPATGIGDHGVDLFFVLSGLCLTLGLQRQRAPRVLPFLVARFARIAPPYYVALAVFAALGLTAFGYPTAISHADLSPLASARELIADTFFSSDGAPIHNTSFWTLGVEMRWYVVCVPLVLIRRRSRLAFAAIAVALYVLYWWTPYGIVDAGTLPCFMLGIAAASVPTALSRRATIAVVTATGVVAAATLALQWNDGIVSHMSPLWHLSAFGLVVSARLAPFSKAFAMRPLAGIGAASYAIYLAHQPVIDALEAHGAVPFVAATAGLAAGLAFYLGVERPLGRPDRRQRFVARVLAAVRWQSPQEDGTRQGPSGHERRVSVIDSSA